MLGPRPRRCRHRPRVETETEVRNGATAEGGGVDGSGRRRRGIKSLPQYEVAEAADTMERPRQHDLEASNDFDKAYGSGK